MSESLQKDIFDNGSRPPTPVEDKVIELPPIDPKAVETSEPPADEITGHEDDKDAPKTQSSSLYSLSPPAESSTAIPTGTANPVATKEIQYPKLGVVVLIMVALYFATLLVALDRTIIATAIPRITDDFNSLGDVGWYGSAYLLTSSAFQLVFGRLYTFCSPKWVFLGSILVFEVGSAVCGAAPNSVVFIIGRAIAGLGSAGIFSGAIILIVYIVPLNKRPLYTGSLGGVFAIASVAGPLLGGALTEDVSWRWCFYINLPIGAVTIIVVFFILNLPSAAHSGSGLSFLQILLRLDPLGNLFLLPSIICLLLALQWGGSTLRWSDPRIISLLVVFGVLFVAFVAVQIWKNEKATIPAHIIKQRSIAFATLFSFFVGASMISMIYYLPIWFQSIQGVSAIGSGIRNIPLLLGTFVTALLSGWVITKIGYYTPFMIACSILMSVGAGLITTFKSVGTDSSKWIGYQALYGIGLGMGSQQASLAAQVVLPRKDVPTGASLVFFAQSLGGSIAVSIAANVFNTGLLAGLEAAAIPGLDPAAIVHAGATELRSVVSPEHLPLVLAVYNSAVVSAFTVSLALACASVLGAVGVEFRSVKERKGAADPASASVGDEGVELEARS
ncbi:hypothetical protein MMC11_007033 [Xylographa trunciseda]|nr:hypothetical protein [Xylographa trunciseda]